MTEEQQPISQDEIDSVLAEENNLLQGNISFIKAQNEHLNNRVVQLALENRHLRARIAELEEEAQPARPAPQDRRPKKQAVRKPRSSGPTAVPDLEEDSE